MKAEFLAISSDWLDARIPMDARVAAHWFRGAVERSGAQVEAWNPPGASGYRMGLRAVQPEGAARLSLQYDNPSSPEWGYLTATGASAPWGIAICKEAARDETVEVNRLDVALDFNMSERDYQRLIKRWVKKLKEREKRFRVIESSDGTTLYLGWCPKPAGLKTGNEKMPLVYATLYCKGAEMGLAADLPNMRRFEVHYRPDKPEYKRRVLGMEHNAILGIRDWTREFLEDIGYTEAVTPFRDGIYRREEAVSDDVLRGRNMQTLGHMVQQYRKAARQLAELCGEDGREQVMRMIEAGLFEEGVDGKVKPKLIEDAELHRRRQLREDLVNRATTH